MSTFTFSSALLACGIVSTGVRNECDPAKALLNDYVTHQSPMMRIGAIFGLGLAYAGSNREDLLELLLPVLSDSKPSMEVIGVTALACGLICVGTCSSDVTQAILQVLMDKAGSADLKDTFAKFLPLGIGLCYLGKQEKAEATLAALEVLPDPFKSMSTTLVNVCAYAGTGNVLKVQELLHICSEHYEPEKETSKEDKKDKKNKANSDSRSGSSSSSSTDDKDKDKDKKSEAAAASDSSPDLSSQQAVAVLGLALIAMGEDIGSEMLFRHFGHLMRYCEPAIR